MARSLLQDGIAVTGVELGWRMFTVFLEETRAGVSPRVTRLHHVPSEHISYLGLDGSDTHTKAECRGIGFISLSLMPLIEIIKRLLCIVAKETRSLMF